MHVASAGIKYFSGVR